jgi:two-component system cell cycle sensor histidine kinase/response regulator CckA
MTAVALMIGRALSPARPGGLWRIAAAALFMVALVGAAVAIIEPGTARLAGIALVGAVGIGAALVLLAVWPRRTEGALEARRAADAAAAANVAWAVTARDGSVLDCNVAYRFLAGSGEGEPPAPPQLAFIGVEPAAALYRLYRAASEGRAREENFETEVGQRVGAAVRPLRRGEAAWWFVPRLSEAVPPQSARDTKAAPSSALIRFTDFFRNAPVGVAIAGVGGEIVESNRAFADFFGGAKPNFGELVGAKDKDDALAAIAHAAKGENGMEAVEIHAAAASSKSAQLYASSFAASAEGEPRAILYLVDTSAQKALEARFAQSQKMQAVGQLAGGIAHDFNNILTAIIGNTELLLMRHPAGDPSFQDLNQIHQDAYRAEVLVKQLLAFSRRQMLQPKVVALAETLPELSNWVRRVVGERVDLKFEHGQSLWPVWADENEIGQAIVNLVVNARDAMAPQGGTVTIRTANLTLAEPKALGTIEIPAGDYVTIEVADTGTGIAKENVDKIFEPFFTTKATGQGTGLGLSTVYGIVKQTGGYISVDSEVGKGARFTIYLPRHVMAEGAAESEAPIAPPAPRDVTGQDTILLVEDEDPVRAFAARALRLRGYNVLEASGGDAALELVRNHPRPIDLLVSDVVMPGMDGPTLARASRRLRPEMRVLFMSGYAGQAFVKSDQKPEDVHFLPKPFGLKQLAAKVKDVLSGAPAGPG